MHALKAFGLWPLTLAMAAVALVLIGAALPTEPLAAPLRLPWWVLALAFAATESTIIHLPVERDAHTISMSEIPLVLGLAFAAPAELVVGRIVGAGLALALYRRQPLNKLAFNVSLFTLEAVTALIVYRAVLGGATPASPTGWIAALVGACAAIAVAASLVNVAIGIHGGRRSLTETARAFAAGSLISVGVALLGTMCVLLVWHDARAGLLLAGGAGMLYLLMRVYGSLSRRHDDLRAVYSFTSATGAASALDETMATSLGEALRLLRAERAEIVLGAADGEAALRVTRVIGGSTASLPVGPGFVEAVHAASRTPPAKRRFANAAADDTLAALVRGTRHPCALVAPLDVVGGSAGALIVAGRIGPDRTFEPGDLDLLDALANHLALTLGRSRMVDRLRHEIAAKQEIIRSKDQLIAAVSHELRTPLTGILGFAELLVHEPDTDDLHEMVTSIAADALDMSHLVEDLLTAARAQIGSLAIRSMVVPLREAATMVVDHLGGSICAVTIAGDEVRAAGDDARVRQILRNLLANADRYGGDNVGVSVLARNGTAVLRVMDDGAGIPEPMREVIFAPYERAHRDPTQAGSLGLGLSISRTLARLMDGDLTYDYIDGWSVFELVLPAAP